MVRQILFATDFSPSSEAAGRVAFEYARLLHAKLHLLHVATAPDTDDTTALKKLAQQGGADVEVITATAAGRPAEEILRYASKGVDLVVLGTHGRTGITRALLGSVAERVARCAPCPVLTVPPGAVGAAAPAVEHAPPAQLRRCLVCANPSEDLICESCRAHIRGEALERKHQEERGGRS